MTNRDFYLSRLSFKTPVISFNECVRSVGQTGVELFIVTGSAVLRNAALWLKLIQVSRLFRLRSAVCRRAERRWMETVRIL